MERQFDKILSEKELAQWLATPALPSSVNARTVVAPPFIRLSELRIGYRKSAVEKWLDARTTTPVSSPPSWGSSTTSSRAWPGRRGQ